MTVVGEEVLKKDVAVTQSTKEQKVNMFDSATSDTDVPVNSETKDVVDAARLPGVASGSTENKGMINYEKYTDADLVITGNEKSEFIDAMITGKRYYQTYDIFGGKVHLTVRSRTSKETQAMYAYIRHELSEDGGNLSLLEGDMQYLLLIAQVEEINGVKYPEMKSPYTFIDASGKTEEPGWMADLASWKCKPEGLVSAIIHQVQLFEYKYWTMVKEASNKNFWNSDTSIAE